MITSTVGSGPRPYSTSSRGRCRHTGRRCRSTRGVDDHHAGDGTRRCVLPVRSGQRRLNCRRTSPGRAEGVEDLAADGVVHAEFRFAPLLHTAAGMTPAEVIAAVSAGLDEAHRTTGSTRASSPHDARPAPRHLDAGCRRCDAAGGRAVGVDVAARARFLAELHRPAVERGRGRTRRDDPRRRDGRSAPDRKPRASRPGSGTLAHHR